jgi:hypothetical protein
MALFEAHYYSKKSDTVVLAIIDAPTPHAAAIKIRHGHRDATIYRIRAAKERK